LSPDYRQPSPGPQTPADRSGEPMTIPRLVTRYTAGAITAQHLFIQCLDMLDPAHPDLVLGAIPTRLLDDFARFVDEYRQGAMVTTYGVLPGVDQVNAATKWFAQSGHRIGA
jgi:hypothetical protein